MLGPSLPCSLFCSYTKDQEDLTDFAVITSLLTCLLFPTSHGAACKRKKNSFAVAQ